MSSASGDSKFSEKAFSMSYLKTSTFKSIFELCDVVSIAFYCSADATMMLIIEPNTNEYWIPSVKVPAPNSWVTYMTKDLIQDIFGMTFPIDKLMQFNKVWLPTSPKGGYISHSIFSVPVKIDVKKKSKSLFGRYKGKIRWSSIQEVSKFHTSNVLKSPELVEFLSWHMNKQSSVVNIPSEYAVVNNFMEISDAVLVTGKTTLFDQIVEAAGMDRNAQETLYGEFLLMTFPAMYLTLQTFSKFMIELGWPKEDTRHLFRSADMYGRGGICFRELLYFLAATEPGTNHGGTHAEVRCRYIFKYLDVQENSVLKRDEMKNFVTMLMKSRKQALDPVNIEKEVKECYLSMQLSENHALTMLEFLRVVGELKLRGTSMIFRAPMSFHKVVKDINQRETRGKSPFPNKSSEPSKSKKVHSYELAIHSVKIQKSGTEININQYWNIENAASMMCLRTIPTNDVTRKESTNKFDQKSHSNELLKALRYLVNVNQKMAQPYKKIESFAFNWGKLDPATVYQNLSAVCTDVKEILKKEARLLDIPAPVYILGDLHGNFGDLLYFEKIFWHVGPSLCPCNLLFLGDYVDRGLYSFEVACYLFAYKLQSPRKVFLLRGNHEIRRISTQWTFEKECKLKFGEKLGSFVFNIIHDVFDVLPLAAVIDGTVFCCHGGIPPPWLCPAVTAINDIPAVLTEPQDQSALAWELMWNDPIRTKNLTDKVAMELLANEGFAVNSRRGTAHIFSVEALEKFLSAHGFTHLVRAHEVVEAGFYLQQKGHLVTVFSSSKYCTGNNTAACLLADQGKLRVLRIEVSD
ncbi:hypothetical protein Zmor_007508 [Zophobas morio]|uniref:Serine/threonine-protein phosphatase n=1 Tax=Zophobas morio TaxID=2755281 RepID=A0AA38MPE5_9CUCU|nr:hypothetical protein Zmor_007508 [Zophobas morio]